MFMSIVRAYCPVGTNTEAVQNMMLGHGGYTTWEAKGHWRSPDGDIISEGVTVFECIAEGSVNHLQLDYAGRAFLNDNPDEQAFLGYIENDLQSHRIYIERD